MAPTPNPRSEAGHSVARLLLSHHPPEHIHRTVALGWGGHRVRLCARCLGLAAGAAAWAALAAGGWAPALPDWAAALCALAATAPAIADFHGQLMRRWESTNRRRMATGAAFGAALALSVRGGLRGAWLPALAMPAALAAYFLWLASGRRRVARLLRHVDRYAHHYFRCQAEDARRAVGLALSLPRPPEEE